MVCTLKGHMEDGKFHPHKPYQKGVRKSRDQKAKTRGIVRKQRDSEDHGWNGIALSVSQLAQMYKKCDSNFAKDGM